MTYWLIFRRSGRTAKPTQKKKSAERDVQEKDKVKPTKKSKVKESKK